MKSLSDPVRCGDELTEFSNLIGQKELDARRGFQAHDEFEIADMIIDLRQALVELTPEQELYCLGLGVYSVKELARLLGIPRSTLRSRLKIVQRYFVKRGLGIYR
jgi:DNA-directed RNA polymerase specialized sigma24 family protein